MENMEQPELTYDLTLSEMEKAVLQALLVKQDTLPEVVGWLKAEMFESPDLGFIYSAILQQYNRGIQPDMLTTEKEMRRIDAARFKKVNGLAPITGSIHRIRHAENLMEYATEVKEAWLLRLLVSRLKSLLIKAEAREASAAALLAEADDQLLEVRMEMPDEPEIQPVGKLLEESSEMHTQKASGELPPDYILTGLDELDALTIGLHRGELVVLAGRPSHGKTALVLQIATNVAARGNPSGIFSLEMTNNQMMDRLVNAHTSIDSSLLRASKLSEEQLAEVRRFAQSWKELPFHIAYTPSATVQHIVSQVMLRTKTDPLDVVIVDYINMVENVTRRGETLDQSLGRTINALKTLALRAGCAVVVVAQMNRYVEHRADKGKVPELSDLRDSGVIEQVADAVCFVQSPGKLGITKDEETGESLEQVGYIYVRKNRNGKVGRARFRFNESFTRITNY